MVGIADPKTGKTVEPPTYSQNAAHDLATWYCNQAVALAQAGRFAESEASCHEGLRIRPDDIDLLNELGTAIWRQARPDEAESIYRQACHVKPDDFRSVNNLGIALYSQGRLDEAGACFLEAGRLRPEAYEAKTNLASVLSDQGKFEEAMPHLRAAQALQPDSADVLQNVGMNLARLGQWDDAIDSYERALRWNPDSPELHCALASTLLCRGDYQRGWTELEWRFRSPNHPGFRINRTFWAGDRLPDRTILLHAELGFGDILHFIRYAPMVKSRVGRVLVLSPPSLLHLLARCKGVDLAFTAGSYTPVCHVHAPLLSLPCIFGTTLETVPAQVPYLNADAVLADHWRSVLMKTVGDFQAEGDGLAGAQSGGQARPFLIGIAWQGSRTNPIDRWRSFPLANLAPLAAVPGVRLISLQVGDGVEQLASARRSFPIIELPGRRCRDFMETAAIMTQLDLIIAPDSAVIHLAGALGLRAWVALCTIGEWRWVAGREKCLWYPTVRRFQQSTFGAWSDVFERMADELRRERSANAPAA